MTVYSKFFRVFGWLGLLSLLALSVSRAEQILDRIIAIVGDQIILQSELDFQQQVFLAQTGQKIEDPARLKQLKSQLLEQMINDRLIQAQAEKDSTLRVTPNEVETALEEHLQRIKSQFATEEEFLQKLAEENLTVRELKLKYREDVRGQILKEGLVNQRLAKVAVSAKEVKDFYNNYRDSLPSQPASVKLSHILLPMKPSQKTLDSLESFAESIRQKALAGEDFAVLAQTFSQDATARTGGDLGFFGKGELDSTFERVAFSLAPGEISGVVWTVYGYHLIKVEERKADQVRARHILILTTPSAQDQNRAERLADSLYQLLRNGADFSSLAQEFSGDPTSQKLGGDLGWVAVEVLEPVFLKAISNLQPGEISPPAKSEYGLHIFSLQDRQEKRGLTLDDDWDTVKALAKRHKTGEEIQKWVADLRIKIYVEIKPES